MELLSSMLEREQGPDWREANIALQQIMGDYAPAGPDKVRSATLLRAGLTYLEDLRTQTLTTVRATCSHTLMRTAEVLDLFDCAEAIFHAALERRESRAQHARADYTFTNPLLADQALTVRLDQIGVSTAWRPRRTV